MGSVIVAGARTPIGKLLGALGTVPATELGGVAIAGALAAAALDPGLVDQVVLGQVLPAGAGQLPARQAAVRGGIGMDVPAMSINKVCLSGLAAVALADQLVRSGECDVVVAGGMESMSLAPHLLPGLRRGVAYGSTEVVDHMAHDGLWDAFTDQAMGALTDACNVGSARVSRADQDAFALRSHQQAARAAADGTFAAELVPVPVPQRRGDPVLVTSDEGVRPDSSLEALGRLRPAFGADGTITAGSASPISDGAAALVVTSYETAARLGLSPIAEIGGYGQVAGPDSSLQLQPANAIRAALAKKGGAGPGARLEVADLDLIEINEAFAAVGLASARALGLSDSEVEAKLNVDGGAIALGHPIGASGARLVLHLALALQRRGARAGVAALCGGGGQGDALVLTAPA